MLPQSTILALLTCIRLVYGGEKIPCPPPNEECDCQNLSEAGDVQCTGVSEIPRNLPDITRLLDLSGSKTGSILLEQQINNLDNVTLDQLFYNNAGLLAIEDRAFTNQPNIRTLDLSNNNFRSLSDQAFFGLAQLETLYLAKSYIYDISPAVFVFTPSLQYLELDGNMLSEISNEFVSLTMLESLLIASNKIKRIAKDAFSNLNKLRRLDLYGNQLTTPSQNWFDTLVMNNGELIMREPEYSANPWKCCGDDALSYRKFVRELPLSLNSRSQYNIICQWPSEFGNRSIESISVKNLAATSCDSQVDDVSADAMMKERTFVKSTSTTQIANNDTEDDVDLGNETTGIKFGVSQTDGNFLTHLSDAHIVLILLSVIILAVILTTIIVHKYHARQHGKAFADFVNNLPNSRTNDSDDDVALTTRTYRQDAPVYGSTGQVVDRHKSGTMVSSSSSASSDDTSSEEISGPKQQAKRKPPPYVPPPESPQDLDLGSGGIYSSTQFNNSSSAGLSFNINRNRTAAFSFSNEGYESDQSDDLWNVTTVK